MFERISIISNEWIGTKRPSPIIKNGKVILRSWQKECVACLISANDNGILNAPTGSGKSIAAIRLAIEKMIKNKNSKTIYSVPQKNIGNGFSEILKFDINNKIYNHRIESNNDLCNGQMTSETSKVNALIKFIKNKNTVTISDRQLACTHQTLVKAFQRLKKNKQLHILKNINLFIDETHHASFEENGNSNEIGHVLDYCISNKKDNIYLMLMTATMFRGDRTPIMPESYKKYFKKYKLLYDRHFQENCNGLKFSYDFLLHDKDWFEPIESVFEKDIKKTIVFIPHPNHSASSEYHKTEEVSKIVNLISKSPKNIISDDNGIIKIKHGKKTVTVVDVVDENGRDERVNFIRSNPEEVDVVIGIGVPKEGFDWPPANRAIIVGQRNSLNEVVQMMGRLFRAHKNKNGGKNPAEVIHVLPFVDKEKLEENEFREKLNNYMKSIYLVLMVDVIIDPVNIKYNKNKKKREEVANALDVMQDMFSDTEILELTNEIINEIVLFGAENEDKMDAEELNIYYKQIAYNIYLENGVDDKTADFFSDSFINNMIDLSVNSISDSMKKAKGKAAKQDIMKKFKIDFGFDVSMIDIDIVKKKVAATGFLINYTNVICGAENLREIRDIFYKYKTKEEHRELIRSKGYNYSEWRYFYEKEYKDEGYYCDPSQSFNEPWSYFTGKEEIKYKTKEEHRELISSKGYGISQWKKEHKGIDKYEGYYYDPSITFKEPWSYFTGKEEIKYKTKEEHRELISSKGYSFNKWRKVWKSKYKDEGYYESPYRRFEEPWNYFTGEEEIKYETKEEHRELISSKGYNKSQWKTVWENKYKNAGYYYHPSRSFNEPWNYFTEKEEIKYKTKEEHRELISSKNFSRDQWKKSYKEIYKDEGYYCDPSQSFNEPWSYFTGKEEIKYKTKEEHRELISSKGYNKNQWKMVWKKKYKDEGYYGYPNEPFNEPWSFFTGKGEIKYKTKEEHRELISSKKFSRDQWQKSYEEIYKDEGYYYSPRSKFKEKWNYFKGENEKEFVSYHEAQKICIKNTIYTSAKYFKEYKKYKGLPSEPQKIYKDKWKSWPVFFGKPEFVNYKEAQEICKINGIDSYGKYKKEYKNYESLPSQPNNYYKEWKSWPVFFGRENMDFVSYEEAQEICRENGIESMRKYKKEYRNHEGLPSCPNFSYEEWKSWLVFFGKSEIVSYKKAQKICKVNGIDSSTKYLKEYRNHDGLPSKPQNTYKDKWESWPVFLGKDKQ